MDRAQGNPFFLAELLHLLIDRGVLTSTGDVDNDGVPDYDLDGDGQPDDVDHDGTPDVYETVVPPGGSVVTVGDDHDFPGVPPAHRQRQTSPRRRAPR